jgi:hypothetical protein
MSGHAVSLEGFVPGCAGKRGVIGRDIGKIKDLLISKTCRFKDLARSKAWQDQRLGGVSGTSAVHFLAPNQAIVNPDFTRR